MLAGKSQEVRTVGPNLMDAQALSDQASSSERVGDSWNTRANGMVRPWAFRVASVPITGGRGAWISVHKIARRNSELAYINLEISLWARASIYHLRLKCAFIYQIRSSVSYKHLELQTI